jgi:response regulator RpfG family c-di-GMP phosphodiesterase
MKLHSRTLLAVVVGFAFAACERPDESRPTAEMPRDMPRMEGMQGMRKDPAMMQRHAQEMDQLTSDLRRHIEQMRRLSPEEQHERMGEHVTRVSQLFGLTNRQMREMDMGMGMTDEQMGQMMGMSGEEHRRMVEEMQALRTEVEQLQTASWAEVQQRMPEHLDRLERMVRMMEQSAAHMRST